MTTAQDFEDSIKPLTDHRSSILDRYIATHGSERVNGYLDGIQDVVHYMKENILLDHYEHGQCAIASPHKVRTELKKFCAFCIEMIDSAASREVVARTPPPNSDTTLTQ